MQQAKIYVGNLSYDSTKDDVEKYFASFGEIKEVNLITDRVTGRSRGFAFIEFNSQSSVQDALKEDGKEFMGKKISVSIARKKQSCGYNNRNRNYR